MEHSKTVGQKTVFEESSHEKRLTNALGATNASMAHLFLANTQQDVHHGIARGVQRPFADM